MAAASSANAESTPMSYQYASIDCASPQQVDEKGVNANRQFFNNLLSRRCYIG